MNTADIMPDRGQTYLVVLDDYLVIQDLAETIECHDSTANVLVRHTISDAMAALQAVDKIAAAFVGVGPAQFAASGLAGMIAHRQGRVVLLGDEAEEAGEGSDWAVLHRPFSQGQILGHLASFSSV